MSLLSRLFGGRPPPPAEPETHDGFRIYAEPVQEAGGYRVAARIEKEIGGATRTHRLIRADLCRDIEEARRLSLAKARQMIDQQGDTLFG